MATSAGSPHGHTRAPPGLTDESGKVKLDIDSVVGPPSPMAKRMAQIPFMPPISPSIQPSPDPLRVQAEYSAACYQYAAATARMQQVQYAAACAQLQAQQLQAQQLQAVAAQQLLVHQGLPLSPQVLPLSPQLRPAAVSDGSVSPSRSPKRGERGRQARTLSTSLQLLSSENPECLFIVRRINKLGFKASRILKRHFAPYGEVIRVLVAHSTVRQSGDQHCSVRRRPSSLGFVQMASSEAVQAVLALGEEHAVDDAIIRVHKFERHHAEEVENAELADDSPSPKHAQKYNQNALRSFSEATTAVNSFFSEGHPVPGIGPDADSESDP